MMVVMNVKNSSSWVFNVCWLHSC